MVDDIERRLGGGFGREKTSGVEKKELVRVLGGGVSGTGAVLTVEESEADDSEIMSVSTE